MWLMAVSAFIIAVDGQCKVSEVSMTKQVGFGISSRSFKTFEGFSSINVLIELAFVSLIPFGDCFFIEVGESPLSV